MSEMQFDQGASPPDHVLRRWNAGGEFDSLSAYESAHQAPRVARVVRLSHVEPMLPSTPNILFDFTIPNLSERTLAVLHGERRLTNGPYTGYRFPSRRTQSLAEQHLQPFESGRLIAAVYSRCLEPLRFPSSDQSGPSKERIVDAFVRMLATDRVLTAVETVARRIDAIRALDAYQPGIGTTTVRWIQYLAAEAVQSQMMQSGRMAYAEQRRLREALCSIAHSVNALDRFTALAHGLI
ncbi:MAG TPA: hypothetical protein VF221_22785 [Chloroflexota bacterium]